MVLVLLSSTFCKNIVNGTQQVDCYIRLIVTFHQRGVALCRIARREDKGTVWVPEGQSVDCSGAHIHGQHRRERRNLLLRGTSSGRWEAARASFRSEERRVGEEC